MKRMLINATQKEELRVALVDGQRLYDLDIETVNSKKRKANIYKAKITRVEPSLEAVFVDYGADRHGFLPIKEISKEYFNKSVPDSNGGRPDYKKLLREGQEIIVQVDKEERGNKGAALTTFISLAGRHLVLMPNNPRGGGVSRRIQGNERKELKDAIDQLDVPDSVGVIVRTAGVGRSKEELQRDLDYQMQVWSAISTAYDEVDAGTLIYQESDIIVRALRDYFRENITQIIIDDKKVYNRAHGFISLVMPDKLNRLKLYQDELPLFTRYQIEAQIDSAYGRSVRLPSGGELVIDYTEAMVSIDINSARSTKGGDVEETALHTNLEAAEEIARQLRLRDIGGLVVIDFIDMYDSKHRNAVEDKIKECIRIDRARVQTARISKFGLLEMSRQRLRPSIDEASHSVCPRCKGQGSIRSTQSVALSVLRLIEEGANKENTAKVIAQLPIHVATFLLNEKRHAITNIEKANNVDVTIIANPSLDTPNFEVSRIRQDDESTENIVSYKLAKDYNYEEIQAKEASTEAPAEQKAAVSTIIPKPAPEKPKLGFFKLVKKALGIGQSIKTEASEPVVQKPEEKPKKPARNNRNNRVQAPKQVSNTTKENPKDNNANNQDPKKERKETKPTKTAAKKPFVNKYATDTDKIQSGRPRSDTAKRGEGKADPNTKPIDNKSEAAASKPKKQNQPNKSKKQSSKENGDRVWVPRAVGDAVPALRMNQDDPDSVDMNPTVPSEKIPTAPVIISSDNPIRDLSQFGQSVWFDNINRDMILSGDLAKLIEQDDLRGITSNPSIFEKAIASDHPSYLKQLQSIKSKNPSPKDAFFELAITDITAACDLLLKTYKETNQTDGMVSIEVSPDLAHDVEKTINEALILSNKIGRDNLMIKVPATEAGIIILEQLIYQGINVNVTLLFSVARYVDIFKAYMRGLQKRSEMGLPISKIRSVASFFISRIDAQVDPILEETSPEYKGRIAIANAKVAYKNYLKLLESDQWKLLQQLGAEPQRLLWASTSTKDPSYTDTLYIDQLIGKETVNTIPPATYDAFKDHGTIKETLNVDLDAAEKLIELLPEFGVDLELITQKLEKEGVEAFIQSFNQLTHLIDQKIKSFD